MDVGMYKAQRNSMKHSRLKTKNNSTLLLKIHFPSGQAISAEYDNKRLPSDTLDKFDTLLDGRHVFRKKFIAAFFFGH